MYETTLETVVLNLMSSSEWLLIFLEKVPGLNSWPMKDKFTFRVCQRNMTRKFIYTGKDFEGTLTILENHSSTEIKVPVCFLDIFLKDHFPGQNKVQSHIQDLHEKWPVHFILWLK